MVQLKVYILAFQYGQINTLELYDSKEVVYDIIEKERTRENKFMFVTPNKRPIIVICEVNYWDGLIKKKNTFTKYFQSREIGNHFDILDYQTIDQVNEFFKH